MRTTIVLLALSSLPLLLASPTSPKWLNRTPLTPRTSHPAPGPGHYNTSAPQCPPRPASEPIQRAIFNAFIQSLYIDKDVFGAFNTYIAADLIEHDPFDKQGRDANAGKLSQIIPFVPSTVLRSSFDNNVGLIHVRVDEEDHLPIALADIYRMNGTCIVEHWDVTQETPRNATNPIAMF